MATVSVSATERVRQIVKAHRQRTESERHEYLGHGITIEPQVFSPFIAPSGYLSLALCGLPVFRDKRVLDVGCGAGILACVAAASGARQVVGVDINEHAVANATENAKAIRVGPRTSFLCGDLFQPVSNDGTFDVVFADLPFTDGTPTDDLDKAFYDVGLRSIREFLDGLSKHLADNGVAYLCWSDLEDADIWRWVRKAELGVDVFMQVQLEWVKLVLLRLRVRSSSS